MGVMWWWRPFKLEDVEVLKKLIAAGSLHPVIDKRYPLSEVPAALEYLAEGNSRGKIVITT